MEKDCGYLSEGKNYSIRYDIIDIYYRNDKNQVGLMVSTKYG